MLWLWAKPRTLMQASALEVRQLNAHYSVLQNKIYKIAKRIDPSQ